LELNSTDRRNDRQFWYYTIILVTACSLVLLAILAPHIAAMQSSTLAVGDVAENDYIAPYSLSYESELLTERQRENAIAAVSPVYTQQDTTIARIQLEKLRSVLAFISMVRDDEYANLQQKLSDLAAIEQIVLDLDMAEGIMGLGETRWQIIQQEATKVLEEVMRNTVRIDRIEETRRNLANLVSLTLPENQARIAASLAAAFITANSVYDDTLTQNARQRAADQVEPVVQSYVAGQTIVSRGSVITPIVMEALEEFDLTGVRGYWQEVVSAVVLSSLMGGFFVVYFRRNPTLLSNQRGFIIFIGLFFIFLFGARLTIPGHTILPYLYPTMAFSLTMAVLFRAELALVSVIPLSILISYGLPNALELTLFYILGSFFGVLTLKRIQRLSSFVWSGGSIAIAGALILFLLRLSDPTTDLIGLVTLVGAGIVNGMLSIFLTILLQLVAGHFLGLSTPLQLIELSRPDHPLLQFILRNAPGTYQHSLQVANLAEQAAERIGADALLTRVGALYHDAGKALNPMFFIENQMSGAENPHNTLDPETSAMTIIQHVTEGMELARKHRLPEAIRSFVTEHHGSQVTQYQYVKAVEAAGGDEDKVNLEKFRYPGPRPQSKETALLMLADACEARLRAGRPKNEDEMRVMIEEVVQGRIKSGELDDTAMTVQDLRKVIDSFVETLRGVYHPRIEYPTMPPKQLPPGSDSEPEMEDAAPTQPANSANSGRSV
jgi:cyclic-di-AMP phosphodiesterase PgpH